ncbi:MAG: SAM-dependent methyltransferase, partial [Sphingorhabdus sp.]|nr:SAM-dependent methyltransferase [Sphingorhabdus sp.]
LWIADLWLRQNRPANVHYVELGPGRGTLANDALRAMAKFEFTPPVHFVETSSALRAKQAQAVPQALFYDSLDDLPYDVPLVIVANEFFDALPIRQLVATHAGWRERVVVRDRGAKFMAMPGQYAADHLVPPDFRSAPANSIYETSPEASGIMYELASRIEKQGGVLLVIDYGYTQPGLGSSLQSVKDHKFADPFENPGEQDLTAHVNFLEIANLGRMRDLRISGPAHQGQWLSALGINQRAESLAAAHPAKADEIFAARHRLTDNAEMGSLFKVLAVTAQNWPVPEGFEAQIG